MEKVIRSTLRYLFQEYLKAPNINYAINGIVAQYDADPLAVSTYLLEKKWIRERWIFADNLISCRITVAGIEEIDSNFIHTRLRQLIGSLVEAGGTKGLSEILQNRLDEYVINLDIVFQLENLGMVKVEQWQGNILVMLTDSGKEFFLKNYPSLFSLMSLA